jgi:hypothetical protein
MTTNMTLAVVVMSDLSRAERWRRRAEELRTVADGMRTEVARATLLHFAADLEEMAERSERSEKSSPTPGRLSESS